MIIGIGTDILKISRIAAVISRHPRFVQRFFSPSEQALFLQRGMAVSVIAGNYAMKEAVSKALGTGIREFNFRDIEVLRDKVGKPVIKLNNGAKQILDRLCIGVIHGTISHEKAYVVANCIIEGERHEPFID